MIAHNENKKSYEVKIIPYLVNGDQFYKMIICDVDWIYDKKEDYSISVRDIFVFPSLRAAVEAMASFCSDGHYPEE